MTPPTTSGAAIQRYKIGYHADEWGQRSSTPSGIPDASGSWVRYADHIATLAAGQATAAQAVAEPAKWGHPAVKGDPDFYTACAWYEVGGVGEWIALPGYSNETEHGVKHLVLEAARNEGYKGTAAGRLLELGWEIRPVFLTPQPAHAQAGAVPLDERAAFEAQFPAPSGVHWDGTKYVIKDSHVSSYHCYRFEGQWEAWKARASHGQAPAGAAPECLTCSDHGAVGNILTAEPCPDCTRLNAQPAPATQQAGESVYAFRRKGLEDFCTCDEARYEELSNKPHLFETRVFYTAPQPSPAAQGDAIEHELAMLIRRIVSSARRNCQDESNVLKLANEAWAYLVRKGLVGSPLRDAGIESDVAPQAADSVLEDAARWNAWARGMVEACNSDEQEHAFLVALDKAIGDAEPPITLELLNEWTDAARKQGEKQ